MGVTAPLHASLGRVCVLFVAVLAAGCMTKAQAANLRTGQGEAMPVIVVQPGVAERLALMDQYRLHDETRKHMMRRPRVTVEELPADWTPEGADGAADGEDAQEEEGVDLPQSAAMPR
jgi:apolipoprotein N-acyltransferase